MIKASWGEIEISFNNQCPSCPLVATLLDACDHKPSISVMHELVHKNLFHVEFSSQALEHVESEPSVCSNRNRPVRAFPWNLQRPVAVQPFTELNLTNHTKMSVMPISSVPRLSVSYDYVIDMN